MEHWPLNFFIRTFALYLNQSDQTMNTEVNPNLNMLSWAITRAGYELREFTSKFPKVHDWLEKGKKPTIKQLEEFSHKVHLPFGYLFLDSPPVETLSFPFFRAGKSKNSSVSLNLYDTIQLMQKRQDWLVDYLMDNDFEPLSFVGKFEHNLDCKAIVADMRQVLDLGENWASSQRNWTDALEHLSRRIEDAGIIMVFNSVVENNNYRAITVDECRGFVIVNPYAPFMFVNAADGKAAQMFTIAHELAHVWIGKSAGFDNDKLLPANDPIEILCDQVAAEFLVPETVFLHLWQKNQNIQSLARYFKISPIVLARRALDLNKISKAEFFSFYNNYIAEVKQKKETATSGGNFYATQNKRLSLRFAAHVNQAVKTKQLLYRDAYKLTGLKGDTYQNYINKNL